MKALAAAFALLAVACAPSTPASRIESNPTLYAALSDKHKSLVQQGRIVEGMAPSAVFLAWGRASRDYVGSENNTPTRIWEYTGKQPVYSTRYYGGYGYGGYGRYGRSRYYGYGVSPAVTYVPYRKATVWFRNDRVTRYERDVRR